MKIKVNIEEAARKYAGLHPTKDIDQEERYYNTINCNIYDAFIAGANLQSVQAYSREEVIEIIRETALIAAYENWNGNGTISLTDVEEWIEDNLLTIKQI